VNQAERAVGSIQRCRVNRTVVHVIVDAKQELGDIIPRFKREIERRTYREDIVYIFSRGSSQDPQDREVHEPPEVQHRWLDEFR
jgi:hypothetical protein